VIFKADSHITYTPAANYNGTDSFTYVISDGHGGTATGTVTVTITAVDDAPAATADEYAVAEDTTLTVAAPGVLANDSDVDGRPITAVLVQAPAHGTINLNANGSFVYVPAANYNGTDHFTYRANDGALSSAPTTVVIAVSAVNHAPTASDQSVTGQADAPIAIALSATDLDQDALTFRVIGAPVHGVLSGAAPNVVYTPVEGYRGADSFTFVANDGTVDSGAATVTIHLLSGDNRGPEAEDQWMFIDEDTPSDVLLAAGDPEGDPLTYRIVTPPMYGTLTGEAPNLVYTPGPNFNGWDYFTFVANDGMYDSNEATVNFWIWEVNDPPVAQDVAIEAAGDPVSGQVVATDAEGDWMYYELESMPEHGTVVFDAEGGTFTYMPEPGYTGYDHFTWVAYDWQTQSNVGTVEINPQLRP